MCISGHWTHNHKHNRHRRHVHEGPWSTLTSSLCSGSHHRVAGFRVTFKAPYPEAILFLESPCLYHPSAFCCLVQTAFCTFPQAQDRHLPATGRSSLAFLSSGMQSNGSSSLFTNSSIQGFRELVHRCLLGHSKQVRKIFTDYPLCTGSISSGQPFLLPAPEHDPSGHPQFDLPLSCSTLFSYPTPTVPDLYAEN